MLPFTFEELEVAAKNGSKPVTPADLRALPFYILQLHSQMQQNMKEIAELKQVVDVLKANCHSGDGFTTFPKDI